MAPYRPGVMVVPISAAGRPAGRWSLPGRPSRLGLGVALAAAVGSALAGCSKEPEPAVGARSPVLIYDTQGIVRAAPDLSEQTVVIEHEDIPGFMPAMTMPFGFKDPAAVHGLKPGDAVAFQLVVTSDDSSITDVRRIDSAELRLPAGGDRPPAKPSGPRLKVGDPMPDFELVDQSGRTIRSDSFDRKALVLTFIFTRCPIPNFCPLMSRNFQALQQAVATDPALSGRVQLLSVSFDEHDTPALLTDYAANYSADGEVWRFATGRPEEIQKLTGAFAVLVQPDGATINHGLATALIGPDRVITHLWRGNGWKPDEIITALRSSIAARSPADQPSTPTATP